MKPNLSDKYILSQLIEKKTNHISLAAKQNNILYFNFIFILILILAILFLVFRYIEKNKNINKL